MCLLALQMSPASDGTITEQELMTITGADFPTPEELQRDLEQSGGGNLA